MARKYIFVIFIVFIYGCASIRDYGESVFSNLHSVSNRIVDVLFFEEENEILIEQLEAREEQINEECSALQKIGYRRMMGEPVSDELKFEAATNLDNCNEVIIQTDEFLRENGL